MQQEREIEASVNFLPPQCMEVKGSRRVEHDKTSQDAIRCGHGELSTGTGIQLEVEVAFGACDERPRFDKGCFRWLLTKNIVQLPS